MINGYLLPRFATRDLTTITPAEVEDYRDELKAMTGPDGSRKLGNRTIVRHLVVLNAIYKRAARVWAITVNPASGELVDRPPVRYSGEFRTLTPDEVRLAASRLEIAEEGAAGSPARPASGDARDLGIRWPAPRRAYSAAGGVSMCPGDAPQCGPGMLGYRRLEGRLRRNNFLTPERLGTSL